MISLGFINQDKPKCNACGLHQDVITPKFPLSGKGSMGIMLILDKPSEMENATGKKFVGQQYTFLEEILIESGISLKEDCWKTHAINCSFQKKLTDSKAKKICEHCFPYTINHLKEKKPKLIICFGGYAASVVLKSRFSDTSAGRWRGLPFWSPEHSCYVVVTYDPSKFYDSMDSDSYKMIIEHDVRTAIKYLKVKAPKVRNPKIQTSINYQEIIENLTKIYNEATHASIDFETNALKPDNSDKAIKTCSYTYITKQEKKKLKTFSFIVDYRDIFTKKQVSHIHYLMRKIALKRSIKKIAHHLKFEENWTRKILGVKESKGWIWCTMYTAHILDERKKYVGLKFQSFLYFQAEAYEEELKRYLVPKIPGGNSLNTVDNAPVQDLLYYNGLDTYYTFLLFLEQRKQIQKTPSLYNINKLFLEGALCFADMESTGFGVVPGYYEKATKDIEKEIRETEKQILKTKECLRFKEKLKREFQFNNDKDIFTMIYDVMKTEKTKETKGGKGSTDAEVLMGLAKKGSEWAKLFFHHTKLCTATNTFVSGIIREVCEYNRIHTFYHLHTTRTGRSSSSDINFQNFPKRDEFVKKLIRSGIISPIPGHMICEADYGSLEVKIAGCYTLDPVLLRYINNPASDMHRDTAIGLFVLTQEQVTKMIRFYAKNGYVFANFYGASGKSCARNLWKIIPDLQLPDGMSLEEHLSDQGFKKYKVFEDHIMDYSKAFWKKFKVFKKWQEEMIKFYKENGYIENKFGFRRRGFLSRNEIINTNIQGSAFQCLLWSAIEINKQFKRMEFASRVMGQIHDSLITSIDPEEQKEALPIIKYVMEDKLREAHKWVITPMDAEFEITEPGGNWYSLKDIKVELPRNFVRF